MSKQRSCAKCGRLIPWTTKSDATLCADCRKEIKAQSVFRPRTCKQCGITFDGAPRAMFCPDCRRERTKENNRKAKKEIGRKLGSIQKCERCGGSYILASGRQKYCTDCAKIAVAETVRAHKRDYQKSYKAIHGDLRPDQKINTRLCVICNKPIPSERITRGIVTCSDTCNKERKRIANNTVMMRKGKRITPPDAYYVHTNPQSGIKGITWHKGKWQLVIKGHYIGIYDTIEAAQNELKKRSDEV